jgi:uncharacterized RDD family membrane protein YckC
LLFLGLSLQERFKTMSDFNHQVLDDFENPRIQPTRYAGFWLRLAAYLIDAIILNTVNGIMYLSTGTDFLNPSLIPQLIAITFNIGYFVVMESSDKQATLGKIAVGIYVTDTNGDRISPGNALGRLFAKIISAIPLFFGFFMAGFTAQRQGLHDIIANTLVVRR